MTETHVGFVAGNSMMDPIFTLRQMKEKFQRKRKKMYKISAVDLEKAYDQVPRGVV